MNNKFSEALLDSIGDVSSDKLEDVDKMLQDRAVKRSKPLFAWHFAPMAAALVLLIVGAVMMLHFLAPEDPTNLNPPPDTLQNLPTQAVEPIIIFNGANFRPVQSRSFALPTVSAAEIENMSAQTMLAIAYGNETNFVFPAHHWFDDFGVPMPVFEKGVSLWDEHEEFEIFFSADSRESAEQEIVHNILKWDSEDSWTTDLRLEYIGENDYYFSFQLSYTTQYSEKFVEERNRIQRTMTRAFFEFPAELHLLSRIIVFRSNVYNSGGFTSLTCHFEPICICDECVPGFNYFPQESLDNYEIMLHILDLHIFNLPLFCSSGDGRIVHRTLEETDDRFIYTYYRVAPEGNGHGGYTGGAFMEAISRIIFKNTGNYGYDPGHYEWKQPRRVDSNGNELETMPPYTPTVRTDILQMDNVELYNNLRGRITIYDLNDPSDNEETQEFIDLAEKAQEFLIRSLNDFNSEPLWVAGEFDSETNIRFFNSGAVLNQVARIYVSKSWWGGNRNHDAEGAIVVHLATRFDNSPCTKSDGRNWNFMIWFVKDNNDEWKMLHASVETNSSQLKALYPENES
jgi:hypothetical protein